jgi:protein SCO1/2
MLVMRFYKVLFVFYLFLSCNNEGEQLPFYISPDFTPTFEEPKTGSHKIKNFVFTNQDGLPFGSDNLNGKIHIANFMFTSCTNICPIMTTNMTEVEKMFENNQNIQLVSFTVTPWIDNPDLLKRYKQEFTMNSSNWNFLTGNKSDIYRLARKSYFAEEEIGFTKDSTDFLHTEHFLLVDKAMRIRGIYNGTLRLEMQQLIKDIHLLNK